MTDHYLEQLRHQLDQTRAELRRAEDELAIHRQRASREMRFRLAWQSARRRAAVAEAELARLGGGSTDWLGSWIPGSVLSFDIPGHWGAAFGAGAKPWWARWDKEGQQRALVHQRLDGHLPVSPQPMALPSEEQMRYRVRQALNVVKLPTSADMVDLVAIAREQQDRALAQGLWDVFLHVFKTAAPEPAREHRCRVWEDEGEWNVSCLACDAYVDNVGNETDAEEWAEDHLEFGNQACGCWHSGCGHATAEPQP